MTLTYENRALYGRNCYAARRANTLAKKGAFQQNTTHDIISNLGRRGGGGGLFLSGYMQVYQKFKKNCGKPTVFKKKKKDGGGGIMMRGGGGGGGGGVYYSNHVTCMNTSKSNRTVET